MALLGPLFLENIEFMSPLVQECHKLYGFLHFKCRNAIIPILSTKHNKITPNRSQRARSEVQSQGPGSQDFPGHWFPGSSEEPGPQWKETGNRPESKETGSQGPPDALAPCLLRFWPVPCLLPLWPWLLGGAREPEPRNSWPPVP